MNLDLGNDDYFLCSWNGTEITQIHTKESLIEEYKETGLIEDNDWSWGALESQTKTEPFMVGQHAWYYGTVIELMDFLIEGVWLFKEHRNDNMTIMYVKTRQ